MNVIIKNKSTGHQQTITKDAWEKGEKYFVGYHLVGDEPELLTGEPVKKDTQKPINEPVKFHAPTPEELKTEMSPWLKQHVEQQEPKPKRKRKKKPENNPE